MVETGLGSLRDFYKTVQNMGGPSQLKRIVAALSTVFLLEDKNGAYWDPTTQARLDAETLEYAKKRYDDILKELSGNLPIATSQASLDWKRLSPSLETVEAATKDDGSLDISAYLTRLEPQATYLYRGSFNNPEPSSTLIGNTGYGQTGEFFYRGSNYLWKIWNCDGIGGNVKVPFIGCGPAAFGAMVMWHYTYRGMVINNVKYDGSTGPLKTYSTNRMLTHISAPVASDNDKPYLAHVMGSCWFINGTATAANGFAGGMTKFLAAQSPTMKTTYSWGRGLSIPGGVKDRVNILRSTVNQKKIPAIVEYPVGGGVLHYSFVKSWKAEGADYGLFVQPQNHPSISVNLGDSLNGETGIYAIYK